jgi:glycerol kinase
MSELLLGVDIGTSSSKGVLTRPKGEVIATAVRPHELSLPRPGWAEHDAEKIWKTSEPYAPSSCKRPAVKWRGDESAQHVVS